MTEQTDLICISTALRIERQRQCLTQAALATRAGLPRESIARRERELTGIAQSDAMQLAGALGTCTEMLTYAASSPPDDMDELNAAIISLDAYPGPELRLAFKGSGHRWFCYPVAKKELMRVVGFAEAPIPNWVTFTSSTGMFVVFNPAQLAFMQGGLELDPVESSGEALWAKPPVEAQTISPQMLDEVDGLADEEREPGAFSIWHERNVRLFLRSMPGPIVEQGADIKDGEPMRRECLLSLALELQAADEDDIAVGMTQFSIRNEDDDVPTHYLVDREEIQLLEAPLALLDAVKRRCARR